LACQQIIDDPAPAFAAERRAVLDQDFTLEPFHGLPEACLTGLADAQLWARADQYNLAWQRMQQAAGQLQAGFAVIADHRAKAFWLHGPVNGNDRHAQILQLAVAVIVIGQATGDEQGIATTGTKQLEQLALTVRRIVGAGDQ